MSLAERKLYGYEHLYPQAGTKLEMVTRKLKEKSAKGELFIAGPVIKRDHEIGFAEWVDFFVAPPKGNFDIRKLNNFRLNLFPGEELSNYHDAGPEGIGGMQFGYLCFDDRLAERKRETTDFVKEIEPDAAIKLGLKANETVFGFTTSSLDRRTFIRVLPHPILATVIADIKMSKHSPITPDYLVGLEHSACKRIMDVVKELSKNSNISAQEAYYAIKDAAREEQIESLKRSR